MKTRTLSRSVTHIRRRAALSLAAAVTADFNSGPTGTVTLNNLLAGHVYATQVWVNDPRSGATVGRSAFVTSSGGNTVNLAYCVGNVGGGPGQYTIGGFAADATSQAFTMTGSSTSGAASTQINAIQVRDVTGIWSGAASGTWDGGSANFTGGQIFATVSGLVNAVSFADTDGFRNAVTNNSITVGASGVNIGTVNLLNSAVAYTFNSASGTGITGATAINKTGAGAVNFGSLANYPAATGVQVSAANAFVASGGAGTVTINVTSLAGITNGTPYRLIGYSGAALGTTPFTLATLPSRGRSAVWRRWACSPTPGRKSALRLAARISSSGPAPEHSRTAGIR